MVYKREVRIYPLLDAELRALALMVGAALAVALASCLLLVAAGVLAYTAFLGVALARELLPLVPGLLIVEGAFVVAALAFLSDAWRVLRRVPRDSYVVETM